MTAPPCTCSFQFTTCTCHFCYVHTGHLPWPDQACDAVCVLLQSKLESLAAQQGAQQGASAKGVSAIAWRGNTSVVAAERVRTTLATALDLAKQVRLIPHYQWAPSRELKWTQRHACAPCIPMHHAPCQMHGPLDCAAFHPHSERFNSIYLHAPNTSYKHLLCSNV